MTTFYKQIISYAQDIRKGLNKVIYVDKDLKIYLINRNELPQQYYIKGDILFVHDPKQYLRALNNKDPTKYELDQFKLPTVTILPTIEDYIHKDLPEDTIREYLLKLPVKDIVKSRRTSKEFKGIIDKNEFWCNLIERDYKGKNYDKTKCNEEYKELYKYEKMLFIRVEDFNIIKDLSERYQLKEYILDIIKSITIERKGKLYFDLDRVLSYLVNKNRDLLTIYKNRSYCKVWLHTSFYDGPNVNEYMNMLNLIKNILPSIFEFDVIGPGTSNLLNINMKNFIKEYNNIYGSFDRDYIELSKQHGGKINTIKHNLNRLYEKLNNC